MTDGECFMLPIKKTKYIYFQTKKKKKKETFDFNNFVQGSILWNFWALVVQLQTILGVNMLSIFEYQVHKVPFEIRYVTD